MGARSGARGLAIQDFYGSLFKLVVCTLSFLSRLAWKSEEEKKSKRLYRRKDKDYRQAETQRACSQRGCHFNRRRLFLVFGVDLPFSARGGKFYYTTHYCQLLTNPPPTAPQGTGGPFSRVVFRSLFSLSVLCPPVSSWVCLLK